MTLRTRRVLFYGLVALFLIVGTIVTLYAQGWRFDIATFATTKVGGIYVESFPANAALSLDGASIRNTSGFLSPGTLISNLFPKNYALTLSANGYDAWTESAMVAPTLVTEMKYAVLIPSKATSVSPAAHVMNFFEAGGRVVTQNASGTIATPKPAPNGGAPTSSIVIAHGTITGHSTDFTTVVAQSGTTAAHMAYGLAGANATGTNISTLLKSVSVTNAQLIALEVNPYDGVNMFAETPSQLFTIDLSADAITPLISAPSGTSLEGPLALSSSWLSWAEYHNASDSSQIVVYDPFSGNTIDASLSLPGHVTSLQWIRSTELGVLGEDGELYRYDVPSETLTKIADDVRSFYPASDGSAVAALESRSIELFFFNLPASQGGYYRFNIPDIGDVRSLAWYKDDAHLFITYPTHVNFLDIRDLALRNFTSVSTIATGTAPQYDAQENALYLIDQGDALVRFDFPG